MASENSESKKKRFAPKAIMLTVGVGVVIAAVLGGAIYYFMQYQTTQAALKDPQQANEQQRVKVIDEVGKLIVLPQNEKPQIATVSDVNKLKGQNFFSQAKNGDIVLIYTQAQKAILYDPAQKKIIEVGPINITQPSPTGNAVPAGLRVALYNGTSVTGLSSTTEKELKTTMPNVVVVSKANARKATYTKTTVVDLTGKQSNGAAQLAKALNGEVGSLPAGEIKPSDTDIVIILGKE